MSKLPSVESMIFSNHNIFTQQQFSIEKPQLMSGKCFLNTYVSETTYVDHETFISRHEKNLHRHLNPKFYCNFSSQNKLLELLYYTQTKTLKVF